MLAAVDATADANCDDMISHLKKQSFPDRQYKCKPYKKVLANDRWTPDLVCMRKTCDGGKFIQPFTCGQWNTGTKNFGGDAVECKAEFDATNTALKAIVEGQKVDSTLDACITRYEAAGSDPEEKKLSAQCIRFTLNSIVNYIEDTIEQQLLKV